MEVYSDDAYTVFFLSEDRVDIDYEIKEVDIYVTENDLGEVRLTLTFDQVRELYEKIGPVIER